MGEPRSNCRVSMKLYQLRLNPPRSMKPTREYALSVPPLQRRPQETRPSPPRLVPAGKRAKLRHRDSNSKSRPNKPFCTQGTVSWRLDLAERIIARLCSIAKY